MSLNSRPRTQYGFTLVELLIGIVLFVVVVGVTFFVFVHYHRWLQTGTERMEAGHRLRFTHLRFAETIADCRQVVFPNQDDAPASMTVFLDSQYRLQLVFLDETGMLKLTDLSRMNSADMSGSKILGGPLSEFSVQRSMPGFISFGFSVIDARGRREFCRHEIRCPEEP